jgi:hypothetical protein
MSFLITKASGEKETFDINKFRTSLKRANADDVIINSLVRQLETMPNLRSTRQIYHFAFNELKQLSPPIAARYSIKNAIRLLGPAGFPFEQFIGELYKRLGYTTRTDYIAQGTCVTHEIDVNAHKNDEHLMIECKFRNRPGLKIDIQTTLYVKARFEDLKNIPTSHNANVMTHPFSHVLIVTNTKFTTQSIAYAECVGVQLLGWSYPYKNNLPYLIDHYKLHPITALTSLSGSQKRGCIKSGLVLCSDAPHYHSTLRHIGLSEKQVEAVLNECREIGRLG